MADTERLFYHHSHRLSYGQRHHSLPHNHNHDASDLSSHNIGFHNHFRRSDVARLAEFVLSHYN